jgi:subtilase family protein
MSKRPVLIAIIAAAFLTGTAPAQLLGGSDPTGGVMDTVGGIGGDLGTLGNSVERGTTGALGNLNNIAGSGLTDSELIRTVNPALILEDVNPPQIGISDAEALARIRKLRHEMLIRANKNVLDRDPAGQPVRRSELVAIDPDSVSLSAAIQAGFRIVADERPEGLGLRILTLGCPKGVDVREGLKLLRKAAPGLQADYNHVFEPAGGALSPATGVSLAQIAAVQPGTRIAMIDGGVASHPSLARASVEQRGFAGPAQPTGHGTAVGSLLVGTQGPFNGAARGAQLFVGDVYGGDPAAGSATIIVRALAWAASKQPRVINISLVGPENRMLGRAIASLRARGIGIVAAVGNDGPAAPKQYPASYPGVIAVTGVDGQDRALREAGPSTHLDFAAPGADLVAALPGNGYTPVRGTSFAAPFVAARLAATGSAALLAAEAVPGKGKVGRGIVCKNCRILPKMVGLR